MESMHADVWGKSVKKSFINQLLIKINFQLILIAIYSYILMNATDGHTPHRHVRRRLVTRNKKI